MPPVNDLSISALLTVTLTLFAVIDMLGSIPIIISLREKKVHIESGKATLAAGFLMILFLVIGKEMLGMIGVDVASFSIAGAIVILLIGLEMILGINLFRTEPDIKSGSIVPIAFPIIAGSGTLTTIISLKAVYSYPTILIAILINLIVVYVVLKSTGFLERILGKSGLMVLRKFFGVILLAIAVKLFKTNIGHIG